MGSLSLSHLLILAIVVFLFFGAGRIPRLADDLAKGIKAFRNGMREEEKPTVVEEKKEIDPPPHV